MYIRSPLSGNCAATTVHSCHKSLQRINQAQVPVSLTTTERERERESERERERERTPPPFDRLTPRNSTGTRTLTNTRKVFFRPSPFSLLVTGPVKPWAPVVVASRRLCARGSARRCSTSRPPAQLRTLPRRWPPRPHWTRQ